MRERESLWWFAHWKSFCIIREGGTIGKERIGGKNRLVERLRKARDRAGLSATTKKDHRQKLVLE